MAKKVFISQPMGGHPMEEIMYVRKKVAEALKDMRPNEEFEILDNVTPNKAYIAASIEDVHDMKKTIWTRQNSFEALGESIKLLGQADCIVFPCGVYSKGCIVEHCIATEFGIEIMYIRTE